MRPSARILRTTVALVVALAAGCGGAAHGGSDATAGDWLFAQSAGASRIAGAGESFVLTLSDLAPVTLAFTDRPERATRTIPSARFLDGWNVLFAGDPPNAVLELAADGRQVPVTIRAARYAAGGGTASYVVIPLDGALATLPPATDLGSASLFIDGASDPELLGFPSPTTTSEVELAAAVVTADGVTVQYTDVNGSTPASDGSTIVLWPASTIPWSTMPAQTMPIPSDASAGLVTFSGLDTATTSYVFAFTTGAAIGTTAASVLVSPGATPVQSTTQLSLVLFEPTTAAFEYVLPAGANPSASGHWMGVWSGTSVPPGASAGSALARTQVPSSGAQGQVSLHASFLRGQTYTAGYFTGPDGSDLAATITFSS